MPLVGYGGAVIDLPLTGTPPATLSICADCIVAVKDSGTGSIVYSGSQSWTVRYSRLKVIDMIRTAPAV